jgi:hypothetical protein
MQKQNNQETNRFDFPIDLLMTIKATGGVGTFKFLRDFITDQVIINLDEEFMNDQDIRQEWQHAILMLSDLASAMDRHTNKNHDHEIIETVKFLQAQQKALLVEEVNHG